jgi:hypothetical protein
MIDCKNFIKTSRSLKILDYGRAHSNFFLSLKAKWSGF